MCGISRPRRRQPFGDAAAQSADGLDPRFVRGRSRPGTSGRAGPDEVSVEVGVERRARRDPYRRRTPDRCPSVRSARRAPPARRVGRGPPVATGARRVRRRCARVGDGGGGFGRGRAPQAGVGRRRSGRRRITVELDGHELAADGQHVAGLAVQSDARHRVTGEAISTVALSVITSASTESVVTRSPTRDEPRDQLGLGDTLAHVGQLHAVGAHADINPSHRPADPVGTREVRPLVGVRVGRVPPAHPGDRSFQVVEHPLLHRRRQLGAEPRGERGLVHHEAPAGAPPPTRRSCRRRAARACAGR